MNDSTIEDERWYGSLSRTLVPYSAGEHSTTLHRRVAELLSPIAAKVVAGAFAEARAEAASSRADARPGAEAVYAALHVPACRGSIHSAQTRQLVAEAKAWRARALGPANTVS